MAKSELQPGDFGKGLVIGALSGSVRVDGVVRAVVPVGTNKVPGSERHAAGEIGHDMAP